MPLHLEPSGKLFIKHNQFCRILGYKPLPLGLEFCFQGHYHWLSPASHWSSSSTNTSLAPGWPLCGMLTFIYKMGRQPRRAGLTPNHHSEFEVWPVHNPQTEDFVFNRMALRADFDTFHYSLPFVKGWPPNIKYQLLQHFSNYVFNTTNLFSRKITFVVPFLGFVDYIKPHTVFIILSQSLRPVNKGSQGFPNNPALSSHKASPSTTTKPLRPLTRCLSAKQHLLSGQINGTAQLWLNAYRTADMGGTWRDKLTSFSLRGWGPIWGAAAADVTSTAISVVPPHIRDWLWLYIKQKSASQMFLKTSFI